jgi:FAD/FMN-containing dehydrogenase
MQEDEMTQVTLEEGVVERLRADFGARAVTPDDNDYETARAVWNGTVDARPAIVARCKSTADVQSVVRLARQTGLPLAVRGGGHNVAGFGTIDGGIVLDLSPMRSVEVDPAKRLAVVGGGATLGDLDRATQEHGLVAPMGVVSKTGVAGLTLSGGLGWLRRKHGLSIDNLLAAEVVTADGEIRRAGEGKGEDADLLWALRGGGGNFGVVTSFTFQLHPLGPDVWLTFVLYSLDDAHEVLLGQDRLMRAATEEIAPIAVLGRVPAVEDFPAELHHAPFAGVLAVYVGPPAEGESATAALRQLAEPLADLSGAMPWVDAQQLLDADYPDGGRYYWKSANLPALSEQVVDVLVDHANRAPADHSTIDLWFNGGAIAEVAETATAFGNRDALYLVGVEANWENAADDEANVAWARALLADLEPHGSRGIYLNFAGTPEEAAAAVRAGHTESYERLTALKARYDPENLFRHNQNIPPAGGEGGGPWGNHGFPHASQRRGSKPSSRARA